MACAAIALRTFASLTPEEQQDLENSTAILMRLIGRRAGRRLDMKTALSCANLISLGAVLCQGEGAK
jgi:hypothetical protein